MKNIIKTYIPFLFVQLLFLLLFIRIFSISQPIDISETIQIDIVVEDIRWVDRFRDNEMAVVADSTEYFFKSRATPNEPSIHELYNTISKGDKLSLTYYESDRYLFRGKTNVVVSARTETETYRSLEEFNRGRQGTGSFVIALLSAVELLFIGFTSFIVWCDRKTIRNAYRNAKKRQLKKKKARGRFKGHKGQGDGSVVP